MPRENEWTPTANDQCQRDSDCTVQPYGHCSVFNSAAISPIRVCKYGCSVDSDCDAGKVCVCGSPVGTCLRATCTLDSDCGQGLWCARYDDSECKISGFACQTPDDTCATNADCDGHRCELQKDGVRRCIEAGCAIAGRPFLVSEEARLAPRAHRSDWSAGAADCAGASLTEEERRALGAAWLENALMEHASIAAFARFTLELLAVGAPAELIRDSNAAAEDETRHAAQCFALASRYTGEALGPGPLRIDGALDGVCLEKLLVTAIAEGCIGETVAAVEAAEQHAHATDPAVREILSRISEDETRHAELAWRFVAWALEEEPSLRAVAAREFARHGSAPRAISLGDEIDLARHGILSRRARSELRNAVLEGVIRGGVDALLAVDGHGSRLERVA